jgi:beta-glucosidase
MSYQPTTGKPLTTLLTTEEKIQLMGGSNSWHLHPAPSQGLEPIMVSDGPHGLRTSTGPGTCWG